MYNISRKRQSRNETKPCFAKYYTRQIQSKTKNISHICLGCGCLQTRPTAHHCAAVGACRYQRED
jgi:hypothetical protein